LPNEARFSSPRRSVIPKLPIIKSRTSCKGTKLILVHSNCACVTSPS
jgi:hypothetical protein